MKNIILIIHYEFYKSYLNKNIGYFINSAISNGYAVDFVVPSLRVHDNISKKKFNLIKLGSKNVESFELYKFLLKNRNKYKFVFLYPSYRYFIFLLMFLHICGIKSIIKTDSHRIANFKKYSFKWLKRFIKTKLIVLLSYKIMVENKQLLDLYRSVKTYQYSLGLQEKNIKLINEILCSSKKEKTILYAGRINYAKGLDRLIDIFEKLILSNNIDNQYKLKVIGRVEEIEYFNELNKKVLNNQFLFNRVVIEAEKMGEEYYKEIAKASLVVLPTRSEGLPNILADCYFCKTIFLTTEGAMAGEIIKDKNLFCSNNNESIQKAILSVLNNIEYYNNNFYKFYDKDFFIKTDQFFDKIFI